MQHRNRMSRLRRSLSLALVLALVACDSAAEGATDAATLADTASAVDTESTSDSLAMADVAAIPDSGAAAADTGGTDMERTMSISSSAFSHEGAIPKKYTCEGDDISPPLAWGGLPEGTRSLVLIVDDPDAPDPAAPQLTWVHWVLYDIPASATGLPEAVAPAALPAGTREGKNNWDRTGYGGPCPPIGRHRYFHKLYALDATLGDLGQPTKADVLAAMEGHVLGETQLMGTYQKEAKK